MSTTGQRRIFGGLLLIAGIVAYKKAPMAGVIIGGVGAVGLIFGGS